LQSWTERSEKLSQGVDVIDLGVGDPDLPTPEPIIEACKKALENPENHKYPSYVGKLSFRKAVADWYKRRFGVELDPEREVITLIGSKEGIAHFPLAFVNPGDIVLCPDPAYPVYRIGTLFAGGTPYTVPLKEENNFLPDLEAIPEEVARKAKIIWVNYPNNPTSAPPTLEFYERLVEWAKEYNVIVASDNAYSEIWKRKAPLHTAGSRGKGSRYRVSLPFQDLQHDRLETGLGRWERETRFRTR